MTGADPVGDPPAEAMLVRDGRIEAIGRDDEVPDPAGCRHVDLDGWALPGLIEPHGHPGTAAVLLSDMVVDLRPVVRRDADAVMRALRDGLAARPSMLLANGWDPLLQKGLATPSRRDLDTLAGEVPLVILHNSGHSAYFNTAAASLAGIDRTTADPPGASFGHDADGELGGTALEAAAVGAITAPMLHAAQAEFPRLFAAHMSDLRRRGITTVSDLSWDHGLDPAVGALRAAGLQSVRLRTYEMSRPGGSPSVARDNGDAWMRQVGVKTWSDGSPWVGNIATSFAYLDTDATHALGLEPGHRGHANFTTGELIEIGSQYAGDGWQLACHAHGDVAVDSTLDAYASIIERFGLTDHRFRLEHVGAMTPAQFRRAHDMGVTVSLFIDHITYWGDVLVDDLFGPEHGGAWADAGAAFAAGHRATFHNDGWVTPTEPLRNMAVAQTRRSRAGTVLSAGTPATRADALRAHTTNAAWQLFSEHEIGCLAPGLYADLTVLDRDPRSVDPEELAEAAVVTTVVGGVPA